MPPPPTPTGNRKTEKPLNRAAETPSDKSKAVAAEAQVRDSQQMLAASRLADEMTQRLAAIVESSEDAIVSNDLDGTIRSWNGGAERMLGYTAAEAIGQPVAMLILPGQRGEEAGIIERIARGERAAPCETTWRRKGGTSVDVSLTVSPLRDAAGKVIGAAKIARNITERKRGEAEMWRREKIYRAVGESIDFGIWICDAAGRNIYASESFLRLVGLTQEECSSMGWGRALRPEDLASTLAAWKECISTGGIWEREHYFKGVDGGWHPVLARGVPIRDANGSITHWAGINLDISAFKKAEEQLRVSERQLRFVSDSAMVYLAQTDREHRLKFVNRPYAAHFGREPQELVGKPMSDLVGATAYAAFKPRLDEALEGRRVEFEMEIPYERFGLRWMRVLHEPERAGDGTVIGLVAVIMDITARKQVEQEMEAARDKAVAASRAKDDFLAALSHELRTPLNPVLLLASEAAENPSLPEEVRDDFIAIRRSVQLEARLIDDLLDLTRITRGKMSLDLAMQDVNILVHEAIATMRPDIAAKGIALNVALVAVEPTVWGDSARLQQVLWNVLKNAAKFTPTGGEISVATRCDVATRRVVIEVRDTGIGMTEAERARAFEAFSQGDHAEPGGSHRFGGVGLGLAISRMLVEQHHGTIEAESEGRGKGASFIIALPLMTAEERAAQAELTPRTATRAPFNGVAPGAVRRRILLVEDHEPTRSALAFLLKRRQFDVLAAASVSEARSLAEAGGIDVVISDVGLPDGNGFDLMSELGARHKLVGIALTGYGMDHDVVRSQAAGFKIHLTKPVTIQALDKALAAVTATLSG